MKDFFKMVKFLLCPYRKHLGISILVNILSALFSLASFLVTIPILELLFSIKKESYSFRPFNFYNLDSWKHAIEIGKNDFYWKIQQAVGLYGSSHTLLLLSLFLVIGTAFRAFTMYYSDYLMISIRTGIVKTIRNQINEKIISLPLSFFSNKRKGDILARISDDVNEVENSIISLLEFLFKDPVLIIIYLSGMWMVSWRLSVFVIIFFPFAGYIIGQVGKQLKKKSTEGRQQWGNLMAQVEETLSGLRIIKAFNAEKVIKERFEKANNTFKNTCRHVYNRQQLAHPISELIGTMAIATILWYGGSLVIHKTENISGGAFIYYLTIFYLLIDPSKEVSKSIYSIQKGLASIGRINKILQEKSDIKDPDFSHPISFEKKIKYENIWFRYKKNWVIQGVSVEISKGQMVALIGQSGSGKSTMIDLLPRFYEIEKGKISIDGIDIKKAKISDIRKLIGIVNQDAILFNDSFFNNIAFGIENATTKQVVEASRIANAYDFIMASEKGFKTNIGDGGCKLSGGQKQRISIARAILKNPPILIFDEATSALDTESERLLQNSLERLMKNHTILVIAHRLSTIKNADLIYVMHEGCIIEKGTHNELVHLNGYYSRLYEMQSF